MWPWRVKIPTQNLLILLLLPMLMMRIVLATVWELRIVHKAKFLFRRWAQGLVKILVEILMLMFGRDSEGVIESQRETKKRLASHNYIPKHCFVAKQFDKTLFCRNTPKYGIFCRKLLKYALWAEKMAASAMRADSTLCPTLDLKHMRKRTGNVGL